MKGQRISATLNGVKRPQTYHKPVNPEHWTCCVNDYRRDGGSIVPDNVNCRLTVCDRNVVAFEILRDIKVDEELLLDYGDVYWQRQYKRSKIGTFIMKGKSS